eukprot:6872099-Alexandrium_andersonii.AAC.1
MGDHGPGELVVPVPAAAARRELGELGEGANHLSWLPVVRAVLAHVDDRLGHVLAPEEPRQA